MNRVHIFGDSISSGIGSLMINYTPMLKKLLPENYKIENHSLTGTTINYCLQEIDKYTYTDNDYMLMNNTEVRIRS